jgi:hypothetical protein
MLKQITTDPRFKIWIVSASAVADEGLTSRDEVYTAEKGP